MIIKFYCLLIYIEIGLNMKHKVFLLPLLFISFSFYSCASLKNTKKQTEKANISHLIEKSSSKKPIWISSNVHIVKNNNNYFLGEASNILDLNKAKKIALNSAFSNLASFFKVDISSTTTTTQREINGKFSYDVGIKNSISGAPITVKDYKITDYYYEKWNRNGKTVYDAYALLFIPQKEINRIQKEIDALCMWKIEFKNMQPTSEVVPFVRKFAEKQHINIIPKPILSNTNIDISKNNKTAYSMIVEISTSKPENDSGEWFASAKINVQLISLTSGKNVSSWKVEATGGAFSGEDAKQTAINNALKKLEEL